MHNGQAHKRQSSLPADLARQYSTARWRRRRADQLWTEPRCVACLEEGMVTAATVADHIERATDEHSFWHGNLQSLCFLHHQAKRQAESHGNAWQPKLGCGPDGVPLGDHPWNR